jgi:phosphomannomutase
LVAATVQLERIRDCGFTVLLDANHGAGSLLGRRLLESLGCRVVLMGGEPDGRFAHRPEPTAENLVDVAPLVPRHGAIVGFCQDPDADRLAVIDEAGTYLGEEYTLALCLDHVLRSRRGPVAINCATSRMSVDVAARHGAACYRAAVGEANVVAEMRARKAVFGGEGNGGPIDPRVGYVRDSFVGMALILDALAERQMRLSEWVRELPRYAIRKTTAPVAAASLRLAFEALRRRFADASVDMLDGLRLDWNDSWLLVRASNTEPIVRLIVEAPTPAAAEQLCAAAAETLAPFA